MPALVKRVLGEAGIMLVAVQLPVQVRDDERWMLQSAKLTPRIYMLAYAG